MSNTHHVQFVAVFTVKGTAPLTNSIQFTSLAHTPVEVDSVFTVDAIDVAAWVEEALLESVRVAA